MKTHSLILFLILLSEVCFSQWTIEFTSIRSFFNSITFATSSNGIIVGTEGIILRTSNSGETWDVVNSNLSTTLRDVFFIDSSKGWIVGDSGKVLITSNGGLTWTLINTNITKKMYSVYFIDNLNGWMVGENSIYKSTDGGYNWILKYSNINHTFFD